MVIFLSKSFTNQISQLGRLFESLITRFENIISKKLELVDLKNGGESKTQKHKKAIEDLKSIEWLEKIEAEAEKVLLDNITQLHRDIAPNLKKIIPQQIEMAKAQDSGSLKERLDRLMDLNIREAIHEWEAEKQVFAQAKQDLVQELSSYSADLSSRIESLYESGPSSSQVSSRSEPSQFFVAPGIAFSVALPRTLVQPMIVAAKALHRTISNLTLDKKLMFKSESWPQSYVNQRLDQLLEPSAIMEKVRALIFSPQSFTRTVKSAIDEVVQQQQKLLEDAEQEERDHATLCAALAPYSRRLQTLNQEVHHFLDGWERTS